MKSEKAFTLIELLVVVLIIGILAAIAVPKYQTAVDKTRFSKLISTARTLASAYQSYHTLTGNFPNDIDSLDINFSDSYTKTKTDNYKSCIIFPDYYCCIVKAEKNSYYGDAFCGISDFSYGYTQRLFSDTGNISYYKDCRAKSDNKRAARICKDFTKKNNSDGNVFMMSPYGFENSYDLYIL